MARLEPGAGLSSTRAPAAAWARICGVLHPLPSQRAVARVCAPPAGADVQTPRAAPSGSVPSSSAPAVVGIATCGGSQLPDARRSLDHNSLVGLTPPASIRVHAAIERTSFEATPMTGTMGSCHHSTLVSPSVAGSDQLPTAVRVRACTLALLTSTASSEDQTKVA